MTEVERKRRIEKLAGFVLPKGNYTLQDHVATSHMSVVYKALDNASRRYVAIKILLDEKFYWRFENEFELSYDLTVTNIAVTTRADLVGEIIFDGDGDIVIKYLVMKWLSGLSLLDIIRKNREDPKPTQQLLEEALAILRRLAPALDTIHQKNIYHRDIKPSNIRFNSDSNERNEPYLLDFGIAKKGHIEEETLVVARESTTVGEYTGTPRYMPPEQWDGNVNSGASDQYALAITIYELLSDGSSPFRKSMQSTSPTSPSGNGSNPANVYAWQKAHREAQPTSIKEYRFDVPEAVWQVLLQAMSKDASQRYENIKLFQEAFQTALHPYSPRPRSNVPMPAIQQAVYRPPPQDAPTRLMPMPAPQTRSRLPIIGAIIFIIVGVIGALVVLPSLLGTPIATPTVIVSTPPTTPTVITATNEAAVAVIPTGTLTLPNDTPAPTLTPTQQATHTSQPPSATPVPASITPVSASSTPAPPAAAVVIPTATPSPIPPSPTSTYTPVPSDTPVPSVTNTPSQTPTRVPSNTPVPPTLTPTLIPTTTPTATPTQRPTLTATSTATPMVKDFLELLDQITRAGSSAARFDCAAYVEAYEGLEDAVAVSSVEAEVAIVTSMVEDSAETLPVLYEFCNREQNRTQNRLQLPSNISNNQFRDLRGVVGEAKRAIQNLR